MKPALLIQMLPDEFQGPLQFAIDSSLGIPIEILDEIDDDITITLENNQETLKTQISNIGFVQPILNNQIHNIDFKTEIYSNNITSNSFIYSILNNELNNIDFSVNLYSDINNNVSFTKSIPTVNTVNISNILEIYNTAKSPLENQLNLITEEESSIGWLRKIEKSSPTLNEILSSFYLSDISFGVESLSELVDSDNLSISHLKEVVLTGFLQLEFDSEAAVVGVSTSLVLPIEFLGEIITSDKNAIEFSKYISNLSVLPVDNTAEVYKSIPTQLDFVVPVDNNNILSLENLEQVLNNTSIDSEICASILNSELLNLSHEIKISNYNVVGVEYYRPLDGSVITSLEILDRISNRDVLTLRRLEGLISNKTLNIETGIDILTVLKIGRWILENRDALWTIPNRGGTTWILEKRAQNIVQN